MPSHTVTLYTRANCHLCEIAKALLRQYDLHPTEIDIDTDPELRQRYDTKVPVVVIDGQERFFGRVDERLLQRIVRP